MQITGRRMFLGSSATAKILRKENAWHVWGCVWLEWGGLRGIIGEVVREVMGRGECCPDRVEPCKPLAFTPCEIWGGVLILSRFIVFMLPPGSQVRMRVRTFSLLLMALSPTQNSIQHKESSQRFFVECDWMNQLDRCNISKGYRN